MMAIASDRSIFVADPTENPNRLTRAGQSGELLQDLASPHLVRPRRTRQADEVVGEIPLNQRKLPYCRKCGGELIAVAVLPISIGAPKIEPRSEMQCGADIWLDINR